MLLFITNSIFCVRLWAPKVIKGFQFAVSSAHIEPYSKPIMINIPVSVLLLLYVMLLYVMI